MKKTLITIALALSAAGFALAQTQAAPAAESVPSALPSVLPPVMNTGDAKVDEQLRALHREMEARIREIRDEYQKKAKAIVGEKRALIASSTKEMRKEQKDGASAALKALQQEYEVKKKTLQQEYEAKKKAMRNATSTDASRQALAQEFAANMKALQQEYEAKKRAIASSTKVFNQGLKAERKEEVRGTSTANPQGNAWGFFRKFFGTPKPATTSDSQ